MDKDVIEKEETQAPVVGGGTEKESRISDSRVRISHF